MSFLQIRPLSPYYLFCQLKYYCLYGCFSSSENWPVWKTPIRCNVAVLYALSCPARFQLQVRKSQYTYDCWDLCPQINNRSRKYSVSPWFVLTEKCWRFKKKNLSNIDTGHHCCQIDGYKPRQHLSVDTTHMLVCRYIMQQIPLRQSICGSRCGRAKCFPVCFAREEGKNEGGQNALRNANLHLKLFFPTGLDFVRL